MPIVFVHGNGDDAAKWMGIQWLFESNGYPRERLYALRLTHPAARNNDAVAMENRSSTTDQAAELAAAVTRALIESGAEKVALVGSSRGGNTIRNFLKFGGGKAVVSHAILCGTPNHGVFRMDANKGNEFNGLGDFLQKMNFGGEVVEGVRFLTIRSDRFDKYAQPVGAGFESPALEGAKNVVLPGMDHREVAFRPEAFREMYEFLTGKPPAKLTVEQEEEVTLAGLVTGWAAGAATNLPEPGVKLEVREYSSGTVLWAGLPGEKGWGPLKVKGGTLLEFRLEREGRRIRYLKSAFLRSFAQVNLRWTPEGKAGSVVVVRPQGYWSKGRDELKRDGELVAEVPPGLPTLDRFVLPVKEAGWLELRGERVPVAPAEEDEVVVAEFLWE
ncbi:MAG: hypothetical protein NW208_02410 [Bryobacter sp.]|nr:hypothetical protein [Bryobacter sp.]